MKINNHKAAPSGIKTFLTVRTSIKAGQEILRPNHSRKALVVRAAIKAGGFTLNHSRKAFVVKAGIKAGGFTLNHSRKALVVKAGTKAGGFTLNHNRGLALRVTSGLKAGQEILRPNHSRTVASI